MRLYGINIKSYPSLVFTLLTFTALSAIAQSPQILQHPQRRDVTEGMSAVFRVEATGTGTLTYQWQKDGTDLIDQESTILQLDNVQPEDSGSYSVLVSDGANQIQSNPAQLYVQPPLHNRALSMDGDGDSIRVPHYDRLQNPTALSIEFWMRPEASEINNYGTWLNKGDGLDGISDRTYEFRLLQDGTMNIDLYFQRSEPLPDFAVVNVPIPTNLWTHVAVTFDSEAGEINTYLNGQLAVSTTTVNETSLQGRTLRQSVQPLTFGLTPGFNDTHATGRIDEVRIWDHARTVLEIAADYSCKLTGLETGLMGYWSFDDGGVDDFTTFEQHGIILGDAHTDLISEGDLPVMGCEQPAFLQPEVEADTFTTAVKTQLGKSTVVEGSTDLDSWSPAGSVPNSLGRQDVSETVLPGMKAFRAISR